MRREDIADIAAFVMVAEEGSFTRAATRLGLSQPALSQIVRRLEERLGVRLLARTTRSVAATPAGERLAQRFAPILRELDEGVAELSAFRDRPSGHIRITAVEHAARTILGPALARFLPAFPDVSVEVVVDYGLVDVVADRFDAGVRLGEQVEKDMIAARITGKVKTAFPDRSGEGHLAVSEGDANIVLVGDTDLFADRMWVQVQPFFGQRVLNPFANNGDFVINAVDNLVGASDLIKVRTRPSSARPFDTVEALKRAADDQFRSKEQELQRELAETERNLTELQSTRSDAGSNLLTDEQGAELERFQAEKLRIRKELRQVRHQLDADIESLGARLKFLNIVAMPLLLTLFAAGFAWMRARRRKEARA